MSFYRNVLVAVAAMGLASAVFADDATTTTTTTGGNTQATQPATADAQTVASNDASATTTTTTTTTTSSDKVDVNTATAKQLMKVKGINAARAKEIVKYRKEHGNFKSLDELKDVKGFKKINAKKLQSLEDQLTVG